MTFSSLIESLAALRTHLWAKIAYRGLRMSMGLTFIISGIRKLPGVKFTQLPVDHPVGAYFQAMYDTGMYWHFISYFQIILGVSIFFNRFAPLTSLLMMPVTVNIWLISIALHMRGTPLITTLMLLGNVALMLWHYEQYLGILRRPEPNITYLRKRA